MNDFFQFFLFAFFWIVFHQIWSDNYKNLLRYSEEHISNFKTHRCFYQKWKDTAPQNQGNIIFVQNGRKKSSRQVLNFAQQAVNALLSCSSTWAGSRSSTSASLCNRMPIECTNTHAQSECAHARFPNSMHTCSIYIVAWTKACKTGSKNKVCFTPLKITWATEREMCLYRFYVLSLWIWAEQSHASLLSWFKN